MLPMNPLRYVIGALFALLLAAALIQTVRIEGFKLWPINIHGLKQRAEECETGRENDRKTYAAAQEQAKANNQAQVQKIEAQHESITNRVRSDYQRDLDRLRAQSKAAGGSPGRSGVSVVPKAPGGTDADGLPAAPCDDLCASEIELRLMHLQNWVVEQMGVRPEPQ